MPVLDIPVASSHDVIGSRAYGHDPEIVAALGHAAALGLWAGGILPVMKHMPGHGRAKSDTHKEPARVNASLKTLRTSDFAPFKALSFLPCAITAHVVYESVDEENPGTLSQKVIETVFGMKSVLPDC